MNLAHPTIIAACIAALAVPALPANAQKLPDSPVRARAIQLLGDEHESILLGRLEPGRGYRLRISLLSQSSPAEGRVEARVGDGATLIQDSADRDVYHLETRFAPETRGPIRLHLTAAGGIDSGYQVRVEWQAEAEPRMARVDYIPSPNQNDRSRAAKLNAIVVHATVTPTTEATVDWFLTPKSQVSAHYVVGRDGRIVQMVDDTARAWHAGVSELEGVKGVNDFSVGIEIVNLNDGKDPYTDAQYDAVAAIIRHIRDQYDVPDSRIVSHEFVARPPGRKSDPKGFDFPRLLRLARNPQ
jgi:N-acetylmuramoyl-L-alanine amidase